jgi:endonuclease-3
MPLRIDWPKAIRPLLKKYRKRKHPLEYKNLYQLLVMVILSAQDNDKNINRVAPSLFEAFPDMKALAKSTPAQLFPYISRVRNFANKANWLIKTASQIKKNRGIPLKMEDLVALPGIGRKSANVIRHEAGTSAEGIVVDLHVVRVAVRLGIATGKDPKQIEAQMMEILPRRQWDAGMAISFLGRETCRPKPQCEACIMRTVCAYYNSGR